MGPRVSRPCDVNTHTMLCCQVMLWSPAQNSAVLCLSLPVSFPLSHGQCSEEWYPVGAWRRACCSIPVMLGDTHCSDLGRQVSILAGGMSLTPLHCSKTVMMMSPLPCTQGCHHPNLLSGRQAMPAPSPELEVSQHGQTGRASVRDHRLQGLPHTQCRHFSVALAWAHIFLKAPRPGQGRGDLCFSATPHIGLSGPGRSLSPAYLSVELMGEKQEQSPGRGTSQLPALLGIGAGPQGAQARQPSPCGASWPIPCSARPVDAARALRRRHSGTFCSRASTCSSCISHRPPAPGPWVACPG